MSLHSVAALPAVEIRLAELRDVEAVQAMFAEFVRSTQYQKYVGVNPEYSVRTIERLITNDDGALFVAEAGGELIGMLGLAVYEHPFSGEIVATEAFWWLNPARRGHGVHLLRRAEKWAKEKGARALSMMAPCDKPRVAEIYEALGYESVELIYQKDLR